MQAITIIGLIVFFRMMASGSNDATGSRSTYIADSRKAKKFGISPSRIRGYDVLIDYIQFHSSGDESPITSIEEGISRLEKIKEDEPLLASDAKNFFSSPYVIDVLGLGEEATDSEEEGSYQRGISDYSKEIGDDWWEEGYEEGTEKPTRKTDSSGESCGNPRCSNPVSAFDFRCFTCRRRFCSEHAGANIECSECSK